MKRYLLAAVALTAAVAGGCSSNNKQAATGGKPPLQPLVTDIAPLPPTPVYAPAPIQPVQPAAAPAVATAAEPVTAAATVGGAYTVKRGDTLYKIAREHYGDGKAWNRIAAANPGLSPSTLKVGQKITLPQ